jgi:hypothetical protein
MSEEGQTEINDVGELTPALKGETDTEIEA